MSDNPFLELLVGSCVKKESLTLMHKGSIRHVSIHMVAEAGDRIVLHCFQFGGYSSKGEVTPETGAWRYLYVDDLGGAGQSYVDPMAWYPREVKKSEGEFKPPAFVTKVLALAGESR